MAYVNVRGEVIDIRALIAKAPNPNYRAPADRKRKPTVKNGYAAQPGTGPEGKTCRDCQHKRSMTNTGNKSWIKCELRRATWTGGEGTDILASAAACSKFQPKE